jgi:hypothetical protein
MEQDTKSKQYSDQNRYYNKEMQNKIEMQKTPQKLENNPAGIQRKYGGMNNASVAILHSANK